MGKIFSAFVCIFLVLFIIFGAFTLFISIKSENNVKSTLFVDLPEIIEPDYEDLSEEPEFISVNNIYSLPGKATSLQGFIREITVPEPISAVNFYIAGIQVPINIKESLYDKSILNLSEIGIKIDKQPGIYNAKIEIFGYDNTLALEDNFKIRIVGAEEVLAVAQEECGRIGGYKYNRWYGASDDNPWCAVFLLWCFEQVGLFNYVGGHSGSHERPYSWWEWYETNEKAHSRNSDYIPKTGDIVFFDWGEADGKDEEGNYSADNFNHIELIEKVVDGELYVIGGNVGGGQGKVEYRKKWLVTDSAVIGFGENNLENVDMPGVLNVTEKSLDSNIKKFNETGKTDGFKFIYDGVQVCMGEDIEPIVNRFEPAIDYYEYNSCSFEGIAKIYSYSGFEITTYVGNRTDRVYSVNFLNDSVATPEGVSIGQTYNDMVLTYSASYKEIPEIAGLYVYTKGGTNLSFRIENNVITSISYEIEDIYK